MFCPPACSARKARMLSALRPGSSSRSSVLKPGARRTSVAESSPPSSTRAAIDTMWRATRRINMGGNLIHTRAARARGRELRVGSGIGVVKFFHGIHAAIRFREQALHIEAILGTERSAYAESHQVSAGNLVSCRDGELVQAGRFFGAVVLLQSRSDHNEFVAAHTRNVIVAATHLIQASGKILEQIIAFKVAIEIIDLFEI